MCLCANDGVKVRWGQGFGSVFIWYGSGSRILGWKLIRIRTQSGCRVFMTTNWKKFTAGKKLNFFGWKTTIYLSLGLHKGRPSYKRSLQLSKENILHFKTWNFLFFPTFVGHFCHPGAGSGFRIRIRIRIHRPDWIRIQKWSTKTTSPVPLFASLWLSPYCCVTRETLKEKLTAVSFRTVWCPQSITADQVLCFSIKKNPVPIHVHTYERRTYVHKIIKGKGCKMHLKKYVDDI